MPPWGEGKPGDPVRYYDRFCLRNPLGQYVSHFREHFVGPPGTVDPTTSEYVPTLDYASPVTLYLQNAANRPDEGVVTLGAATTVKLIATEDGLGAWNVFGKWSDSRDCYYFNDYLEGDYDRKQTWRLERASTGTGPLRFGDKAYLANDGNRLGYNYSALYGHTYLSTDAEGSWWTVEPVLERGADADALQYGDAFHLRHVRSGATITAFELNWGQWKPTVGKGAAMALRLKLPHKAGLAAGVSPTLLDGAAVAIVSTHEALAYGGRRCDNLYSGERSDLYYYYADYSPPNSTWHLSLAKGFGALHDGDQVRIINVATGQFLVPRDGHLTTVATASADDLWALLRTR